MITWSSDALGVTDFAAVEGNNNTIRVYNTTYEDNSGNVFVISILELCDGDPMYLTDITCSADNGLNPASDFAVVNTIPTGTKYLLALYACKVYHIAGKVVCLSFLDRSAAKLCLHVRMC